MTATRVVTHRATYNVSLATYDAPTPTELYAEGGSIVALYYDGTRCAFEDQSALNRGAKLSDTGDDRLDRECNDALDELEHSRKLSGEFSNDAWRALLKVSRGGNP